MIILDSIPTIAPKNLDKNSVKEETKQMVEAIGELQNRLFAEKKQSLLVILQGMDGTGKDSTTNDLFKDCSHAGVNVAYFKKPSDEEAAHDFIWRAHRQTPERGIIQVFNRSYYEDILIHWVHGWIDDARRDARIKHINAFENLLIEEANTTIVKFYMHISFEEQEKQLTERVEEAHKFWKHNDGDWEERKLWDKYRSAYEFALNKSELAWTILPCDQEWYRDYVAAKTILDTLKHMNPQFPALKSSLFFGEKTK